MKIIILAVVFAIRILQANCFFFPDQLPPNIMPPIPITTEASLPSKPDLISTVSDLIENSMLFLNTFPPKPIPSVPMTDNDDLPSKIEDLSDAVSELIEHLIDALKSVVSVVCSYLASMLNSTKDNDIKRGIAVANSYLDRIQQYIILPLESAVELANKTVNDIISAANLAIDTVEMKINEVANSIDVKINEANMKYPESSSVHKCLIHLKDAFKNKSQLAASNVKKCILDKVAEAKTTVDNLRLTIKDVCQNVQQSVGEISACVKPANETSMISNLKAAGCLSYASSKAVINGYTSMVKIDKNVASILLMLDSIKINCATCAAEGLTSFITPDLNLIKNSINACIP